MDDGLTNKFYMDDVMHLTANATDLIMEGLKPFNITVTIEQEDAIFLAIQIELEKLSNGYYRHEH